MNQDRKTRWERQKRLLQATASGNVVVIKRDNRDVGTYYIPEELEGVRPGILRNMIKRGGRVPDHGPGKHSVPRILSRIDRGKR